MNKEYETIIRYLESSIDRFDLIYLVSLILGLVILVIRTL